MFKVLLTVVATLTVAIFVYFAILGHHSKSGKAPGMLSGTLVPCADKPNCVCSEFTEDTSHYIEPLDYSGTDSKTAWNDILQAIKESDGEIIVSNDEYIAATFSVSVFGFIDDLECRLDASGSRVHIRSASRVGRSDLGVNRKRVETITLLFKQN